MYFSAFPLNINRFAAQTEETLRYKETEEKGKESERNKYKQQKGNQNQIMRARSQIWGPVR